jgi:hypothetical protein
LVSTLPTQANDALEWATLAVIEGPEFWSTKIDPTVAHSSPVLA